VPEKRFVCTTFLPDSSNVKHFTRNGIAEKGEGIVERNK
jgi:hypothetical protein